MQKNPKHDKCKAEDSGQDQPTRQPSLGSSTNAWRGSQCAVRQEGPERVWRGGLRSIEPITAMPATKHPVASHAFVDIAEAESPRGPGISAAAGWTGHGLGTLAIWTDSKFSVPEILVVPRVRR